MCCDNVLAQTRKAVAALSVTAAVCGQAAPGASPTVAARRAHGQLQRAVPGLEATLVHDSTVMHVNHLFMVNGYYVQCIGHTASSNYATGLSRWFALCGSLWGSLWGVMG
eukprot:176788-Chlamydomonas_euryale.AAC.2